MTNTQVSMQTTTNRATPADDQPAQQDEVFHDVTFGRLPAEWARTVATLSAVNRVLFASGQQLLSQQMELAQNIARDMMADMRSDRVQRSSRRAIAYGTELASLLRTTLPIIEAMEQPDARMVATRSSASLSAQEIRSPPDV